MNSQRGIVHNTPLPRSGMLRVLIVTLLFMLFNHALSQAQTNITSSGLSTAIDVNGNIYDINGGTVKQGGAGSNLFHSFGEFSVGAGDIARFNNTTGINNILNILSRVTGANPSNIFGTIRSTIDGANFYLINPNGVVFGPNAALDVGASAYFSTATSMVLTDGVEFGMNTQANVLTSAPVEAFGFSSPNPAAIGVQGASLTVAEGRTLSLIGGNRTFETSEGETVPSGVTVTGGTLSAPKGQVHLASVTSSGEILLTDLTTRANSNGDSFTTFGNVALTDQAFVNVSGEGGGTVLIRGGEFVMDNSLMTNANTDGVVGGSITVDVDSATLSGAAQIVSRAEGAGDGAPVTIRANDEIVLTGGAFEGEGVFVEGQGVPIEFVYSSGVFTTTSSNGNGGAITLDAPSVRVGEGGRVGTITSGDGTSGGGRGGDIVLNVGNLEVSNGGQVVSRSGESDFNTGDIVGSGAGGDITITATDSVQVSGVSLDVFQLSEISSTTINVGNGGNILVSAPIVSLENGGTLASETRGEGEGGIISVTDANQVTVSGFTEIFEIASSIKSTTSSDGKSGSINITASSVNVDGAFADGEQARIRTSSFSDAASTGDITLIIDNLSVTGGGLIESNALSGTSGLISITAKDSVTASGQFDADTPSRIENRIERNGGVNGGISITAPTVLLTENGLIRSEAQNLGSGAVNITGEEFITVSAGGAIRRNGTAVLGEPGIKLKAPTITLNQGSILTRTNTDQDSGGVSLEGNMLVLTGGGGQILTQTQQGAGEAGPITLTASDSVHVSGGFRISASSSDPASGGAGAITVTAENTVSLTDPGTGLFSLSTGSGVGGPIVLQGNNVQISNSAEVSARSTGTGDSGNIRITATNGTVQVNKGNILTSAQQATGGDITIAAGQDINLQNSTTVSAESSGAGNSGAIGIGAGGNVLSDNSTVSTSAQQAIGGDITISSGQDVSLQNNTLVSAESFGPGNAGDITIGSATTGTILVENSTILTNAANADGGNIKLDSNFMIQVVNSLISSSVGGGAGAGGNINFDPQWIVIQNSQILANAFGGPGGNITFTASEGIFIDPSSTVDASSQFGTSGSVDVQAPVKNIKGVIAPLPEHIVNLASLYAERCAAQKGGQFSSFVQGGPEGVPPAPGGFMPSPLQMGSLTPQAGTRFLNDTSSGTMVKRLGLDQGTDEHDWDGSMRWMFGDATQGCAA